MCFQIYNCVCSFSPNSAWGEPTMGERQEQWKPALPIVHCFLILNDNLHQEPANKLQAKPSVEWVTGREPHSSVQSSHIDVQVHLKSRGGYWRLLRHPTILSQSCCWRKQALQGNPRSVWSPHQMHIFSDSERQSFVLTSILLQTSRPSRHPHRH